MKADYLSYKRATSVSLLGLGLQLAMGLTLLIYAFVARPVRDESALTGAVFILWGSGIWLLLAILFDQHRRERIEQMETEALGMSGVRDSSAFSEGGGADDLRVAHKRLVWMHKFMVPVASLLFALGLGLLAFWRFTWGGATAKMDPFPSSSMFGVVIGLSLAVGFIGFIFARYVAGMAKQPVWAHLRAGAGAAVGASVFGILNAAAQFVDFLTPTWAIKVMLIGWPILMGVLAVEVVLNFLLGLYSPRKAGEFSRPAVDSKIMSFIAAPDRIAASVGEALNYQFGFDVTGNWFYQLLTRSVSVLIAMGVLVVWGLSCITIVQPNEQGLRVRLGVKMGDNLKPGAYLKLPWPFEKVETLKTTTVRRLDLGGAEPKMPGSRAILWTNDHGVAETYFAVRPAADDVRPAGAADAAEGKDFALANIELPLFYAISDLAKFDNLCTPEHASRDTDRGLDQREELLKAVAQREAMRLLATMTIDEVLGSGREKISRELKTRVEQRFALMNEGRGAGVEVLFIGVEGVHPPRDTAAAFEDIVKAEQKRAANVETAQTEANTARIRVAGSVEAADRIVAAIDELRTLTERKSPEATLTAKRREIEDLLAKVGGTAATEIQNARAERWSKHMAARAAAEAYAGQIAGYQAAPEVYVTRVYFDALTELLRDARMYIIANDGPTHITTNLEDAATGGSIFLNPKKSEE